MDQIFTQKNLSVETSMTCGVLIESLLNKNLIQNDYYSKVYLISARLI